MVTFALIIPAYNSWAKRQGKASRWIKEPTVKTLKAELAKTPLAVTHGSPRDPSSEEPTDHQSDDATVTEELDPNAAAHNESHANSSHSEDDEEQPLDLETFNKKYIGATVEKLINHAPNKAQLLRVMFHDDVQNLQSFVRQSLIVAKMSKKYDSPAIFIAKEPGEAIHFISGIYWNNTFLLIDLNGIYDGNNYVRLQTELHQQQEQDTTLKSEQITLLRANRKIQNDRDIPGQSDAIGAVSCAPIASEFVRYTLIHHYRYDLLDLLKYIKIGVTSNTLVDISPILPPQLEALVSPAANQIIGLKAQYVRKVLALRAEHDEILAPLQQDDSRTPEQELFDTLVFGGDLTTVDEHIDSVLKERNNHLSPQEPPPSSSDSSQEEPERMSPIIARYRRTLNPESSTPDTGVDNTREKSPTLEK